MTKESEMYSFMRFSIFSDTASNFCLLFLKQWRQDKYLLYRLENKDMEYPRDLEGDQHTWGNCETWESKFVRKL